MDTLTLRPAVLADKASLVRLEQALLLAEQTFDTHLRQQGGFDKELDQLITRADTQLLVAQYGSDIVATGYVQIRASKPV